MTDVVISAEGLGKKYLIGHEARPGRYTALRDVIALGARTFVRKARDLASGRSVIEGDELEEFWALRDVNFEIGRGEVVGIIGRNGAGKSTLLKVLSRITEPTTGRVRVTGRVASLLEVGTGFHAELTGRENIFLNGAILGMRRAEIRAKFDEIVAFAEIDRYLDTPVKRYSSGMYVRLAFAVAAHLEPDILVVDEVLAVGDAEFRKKCMGKMQSVSKSEGRTILFVSHDMSAIQGLCTRALLIKEGHVSLDATPSSCVSAYLGGSASGRDRVQRVAQSSGAPTLVSAEINAFGSVDWVKINCCIVTAEARTISLDLRLTDHSGYPVGFGSLGTFGSADLLRLAPGENRLSFRFPSGSLAAGAYFVSLDLTVPDTVHFDRVESCLHFDVARAPIQGKTRVLQQSWGYGSYEFPLMLQPVDESGPN